jgi:ABC-type nickel/cobalt efflux system permease component RcnA
MAHPMGNFSVNHYSRLHFTQTGVELTYVLDLAEIPTFQLQGPAPTAEWLANLNLQQSGRKMVWHVTSVTSKSTDGAGGMPTLRTVIVAEAPLSGGKVTYEDRNFPGRAGWKEIVVDHSAGVALRNASQSANDLSAGLTVYPTDPSITPPQDLTAHLEFSPAPATVTATETAAPSPAPTPAPAPAFVQQQPSAPGSVVRGDFLSRMLQRKVLGWRVMSLCLLAAFGLGALHAMSPGHGKTIVAAYLVGSRGTLKHAGMLGFVVTFTHTFTVFLLGLGVLFFQQYFVPEKIVPALGAISGLSIIAVGLSLLYKRASVLLGSRHRRAHPAHNHNIEGEITPGNLIALGVSGGMVPCPSALVLMLSAIALGRPAFGLLLLIGFSSGLALVLMAIGMVALYARNLLPDGKRTAQSPAFRLVPVFSAVVVICLGLMITAVSAGWMQPMRFLS